ncbi:MAG: hypothetical protein LBG43_04965 [Treponema sp.]|nr:hypothetical protein [Treponema sp.]
MDAGNYGKDEGQNEHERHTVCDRRRRVTGAVGNGLMDEGEFRHLFGKYTKRELVDGYNRCVHEHILPQGA